MNESIITGKQIKIARGNKGLTQKDVADRLHVTTVAISNYERGKNRVDEDLRKPLGELLGIPIEYSSISAMKEKYEPKPLSLIGEIKDLLNEICNLINTIEIDCLFSGTIRTILRLLAIQALGYSYYYEPRVNNDCDNDDWNHIASVLQDVLTVTDKYPIPENTSYPFRSPDNLMKQKIEWMSYQIGSELFEDNEQSDDHHEFLRLLGRYAEASGYDLISILPETDNSMMTSIKTALFSFIDVLYEV